MIARIFLVISVFFIFLQGFAQSYSSAIYKGTATIAAQKRDGFTTYFDYPIKNVEKGWWQYCRTFGRPLNMKSYYQVTIPSDVNSGNVDLVLLSRTTTKNKGTTFFLALNRKGIPAEKMNQYQQQVYELLQNFKRQFYIDQLESVLEIAEKKAAKASRKVEKTNRKEKSLGDLKRYEDQIAEIKNKIRSIYETFD